MDNQIISCSTEIVNKKIEYLTFENGMFASKTDNKDVIILNINEGVNVIIPEKKGGLNAGAIIGIIIAGLVLIAVAAFLVYKFLKKKRFSGKQENYFPSTKRNNDYKSKDIF